MFLYLFIMGTIFMVLWEIYWEMLESVCFLSCLPYHSRIIKLAT